MIRTAFTLAFVIASSVAAHANVQTDFSAVNADRHAQTVAECSFVSPLRPSCVEREVTRGHADLTPRQIAKTNPNATASA